ncbi:MAG: HAD hydrolase-like protein, partial [Clostridia bacterium]
VQLVRAGAKLIGTNPDLTGPIEGGIAPACKALMSPIELATGRSAYFLGKPNPLMMRHGLRLLDVTNEECAIVGDRMDTDVVAGVESGIDTVLVLSGVTNEHEMRKFPYRPNYVLNSVGDISPEETPEA